MAAVLFRKSYLDIIKEHLISRKETIAVGESVTAGLLQLAFSGSDDAGFFYQGGITAYNLGQKARHLLIEPIQGLSCNCVSQDIAESMALNVCPLFRSDWGIGVTGYAAPVPESGNKLFAYYAIAHKGEIVLTRKIDPKKATAFDIQLLYAREILKSLKDHLASF